MIDNLSGKYFFLSNYYNCYLTYEDVIYCSTEAAFQAAKTLNRQERVEIAKMNPAEAKAAGQKLALRSDWEDVKDQVMYDVCYAKFTQNEYMHLKERLLATGDEEIVECNTWHDNCWGDCKCDACKSIKGENRLGKILMKIREEIRSDQTHSM